MTKLATMVGPLLLAGGLLLSGPSPGVAAPEDGQAGASSPDPTSQIRGVDPRADRILREMGEYLATAQEFTFQADVSYDKVRSTGEKILFGGRVEVSVRRPDRLHGRFDGDERRHHIVFKGRSFTFYNVVENLYARMEVPAGLDAAIDAVFEATGISVPIADLVYSNPYRTLIENAQTGFVVGRHAVAGVPCHHLAFSNEAIDWQIWIEDGPRPVPRRLVITYKNEPNAPQYDARLLAWDFEPRLSSHYFEFHPPAGSAEIDFLPVMQKEVEQ